MYLTSKNVFFHSILLSYHKFLSCSRDGLFNTCSFESSGFLRPDRLLAITYKPRDKMVVVLGCWGCGVLVAILLVWSLRLVYR